MNYYKHYDVLINRGLLREANNTLPSEYTEIHHILPKSMGGTDIKSNLVILTGREHFIAHQLLVKMHPEHKGLSCALFYMTCGNENRKNTNRTYAWHRRRLSEYMSISQQGENNSQYNTRWIHNLELQQSKKIPKNAILPPEWNEGRKLNFSDKIVSCHYCNNNFIQQTKEIFCSKKCRDYYQAPWKERIDNNIPHLLEQYNIHNSIAKVLRDFGIKGTSVGNKYLSNILKKNGHNIIPRGKNFKEKA